MRAESSFFPETGFRLWRLSLEDPGSELQLKAPLSISKHLDRSGAVIAVCLL